MLEFIGVGLYDEDSITRRGTIALAAADRAYLEGYTSVLPGTSVTRLEEVHDRPIEVVDREAIEGSPDPILEAAREERVAFLTGGDPMIATTHVDLRLRAHRLGIETRVVHGTSAATAAAGLTGLQQYRFGRAVTVPFPEHFPGQSVPDSVLAGIEENRARGLHTLAYLDLDLDDVDRSVLASDLSARCLDAATAASLLAGPLADPLAVTVARAGSDDPVVAADRLSTLATRDVGGPLHLLVLPGTLHEMEAESLAAFAGAPRPMLKELVE